MTFGCNPAAEAAEAAPILSEWEVKSPLIPVFRITLCKLEQNHPRDTALPLANRKSAPHELERLFKYSDNAKIGHTQSVEAPRTSLIPSLNGSVFDDLS